MSYGALEDANGPLAPAVPVSRRRIFGGVLIAVVFVVGCLGVYGRGHQRGGLGTSEAALDAGSPKPFDIPGVVSHDIDSSQAPFDALTGGNVLPKDIKPVWAQGLVYDSTDVFAADADVSAALCPEFDDDGSFPDAACDCGDTRTQCHGNMDRLPAYKDACYEAACGAENMRAYDAFLAPDSTAQCAGLVEPVWGVPCLWQAVKAMPSTCGGTFAPTFPTSKARNAPDPYPELDAYERYALGYSPGGNFAGYVSLPQINHIPTFQP